MTGIFAIITIANCVLADESIPPSPSSIAAESTPKSSSIAENLWQDRPLNTLKATINPTQGDLPTNVAAARLKEAGLLQDTSDESRFWLALPCEWDAPVTRHLPLFFEEPNLERSGYTHRCYIDACGYETNSATANCLQPFVSAVHFFGRIPLVPLACLFEPPTEPIYTLGVDRPGSPVCYREHFAPYCPKRMFLTPESLTEIE